MNRLTPIVKQVLADMAKLSIRQVTDFSIMYPALWRVMRPERSQTQRGTCAVAGDREFEWQGNFDERFALRDIDILALTAAEVVDYVMEPQMAALEAHLRKIETFLVGTALDLERTGVVYLAGYWLRQTVAEVPGGTEVIIDSCLAFVPWAPPADEAPVDRPILAEAE